MKLILPASFTFGLWLLLLVIPVKGQVQSTWVKDSLRDVRLHEELTETYEKEQIDWWDLDHDYRFNWDIRHLEITSQLLEIKFDSIIFLHHLDALQSVGQNLVDLGEYEKGLFYYDSCIAVCNTFFGPLHFDGFRAVSSKATIYITKGDYEKALNIWKDVVRIIEANPQHEEYHKQVRNYHHNLGLLYEKMGKWGKAIQYYQKAANMALARQRYGQALADLDRVGYYQMLQREYELSEATFKQIYGTIRKKIPDAFIPNKYGLLRLVTIYTAAGKESLAEEYLQRALPLPTLEEMHSRQHFTIASTLQGLGEQYMQHRKFDKALDCFQEEYKIYNHFHGSSFEKTLEAQSRMVNAYLTLSQADSAMLVVREILAAMHLDINYKNPALELSKYSYIMGFLLPITIGQYAKAWRLKYEKIKPLDHFYKSIAYYGLASQMVDALRKDFFSTGSKQILISRAIELYEGAVETALQLYEVTKEPQHLETAFSFAEKSKSVLLLESIQGSKAHSFAGVPKNLIEQEKDLKIDLAFYSKQLYDEQNKKKIDNNKITLWENRSLQLRNEYDSLLTVFQQQYPEYYQLKYDIQYATVDEIRNYLPNEKTACIEYFWGKESLYAFLITKDKVNCIRKPLSEEMNSHLEAFTTLLSRPDLGSPETYAEHAGYLYDFLLADALKDTEVEHLIIIPDGRLGYIPFQVLIDNRQLEGVDDYRKLPYVINNYEVRYEYSSTLLLAENTPKESGKGFLGFAPKYGESESGISVRSVLEEDLLSEIGESAMLHLAPLHFTQAEVENINNLFSGQSHTGELATEATFKKEAANHSILHLAMHAHTSDENPMYSRLIFQQGDTTSIEDGMLHAYELYNMDLQAELAVLSACDTGTGQLQHGEGIMSLSRAFKYAGCPNIVMSLWQADDASTKDIMVQFYNGLKNGKGKAKALRTAKMEYLRTTGKDKSHPYYWATFVLAGDDEPVGIK